MFRRVSAVDVFLWGRHVGRIAPESGSFCQFQYDPEFVRSGLQIAPIAMPLRAEIYRFRDFDLPRGAFMGLPGVFADSLPDSFGNRLVEEWLAARGIPKGAVTPLDRLVYVGSRGMGALTYEPDCGPGRAVPTALDMRELAEDARIALNADISKMEGADPLREIIRVGTSAGGAQAKAVVGWNRTTGAFVSGAGDLPDGFEHWIVKFSPDGDPEAGRGEYETHLKALAAGVAMSECRLLEIGGAAHFMTRRFDRDGPVRHHLQTLCALQHLPHGGPSGLYSYDVLFDTAEALGLGYEDKEQLFRRMAFNVFNRETDDHTKNFSFLMRGNGVWELAPAYDLTGAMFLAADSAFDEWQNPHALSVNGRFSGISDADLLAVGARYGLGTAPRVLAEVKAAFP